MLKPTGDRRLPSARDFGLTVERHVRNLFCSKHPLIPSTITSIGRSRLAYGVSCEGNRVETYPGHRSGFALWSNN